MNGTLGVLVLCRIDLVSRHQATLVRLSAMRLWGTHMRNTKMHTRRHPSSRTGRGFSLVELVIVIVIIGVIAAIAIPRVGRGAKGAGESALAQDLAVLRNAIELYSSQHNGDFPGLKGDGTNTAKTAGAFRDQLLKYTSIDGETSDSYDSDHPLGPYLRKSLPPAPVGVNRGSVTVLIDENTPMTVTTGGGEGWVYNPLTGDLIVNSTDANESGLKTYDEY
jgi:prepilin-type N-terminal cleavage/methylation domain-containing protein